VDRRHSRTHSRPGRSPLLTVLVLTLAALVLPLSPPAAGARAFPTHIDLPDGFQPEGIAIGRGPVAYLGSRADGDIRRVDLRTGRGRTISEGPGTPSVGVKLDRRGRLFVAGGSGGDGRVVDTRTGEVLASYRFARPGDPTFVNDVVLTDDAAWFTDSRTATLYRVPLGRRVAGQDQVRAVALGGDWLQTPDVNNANGIAETPDESALLVVNSAQGRLYRVSKTTGAATVVDLGGEVLTNGDGLLVEGRTLYVVRNRLNEVAVLTLNRSGTRGALAEVLTSPDFDVPTTVASFGKALYLPNARFTNTDPEPKPYWLTRLVP
jgi:sugar lactone lactonase YvrE